MRAEIENAFFYKNERKLILDFKKLGKRRYFISFYSYLRKKKLLQRLLYTNFVSVKNGLRYKFIKLNYIPNISKYEFVFEVFNTKGA
nr:MAG TPA: hypothetical protein [Caudoviricetes sp.]